MAGHEQPAVPADDGMPSGGSGQAEVSVDPANCMAHWKIGSIVLEKNGSADEALADIDRALSMCPGLTDARAGRARALIKLNRNAEAATDLEAAAKADPAEPSTHFLLAKVYRASDTGELRDELDVPESKSYRVTAAWNEDKVEKTIAIDVKRGE